MSESHNNATDLDVAEAMCGAVKQVGGNVLIFRAEGILSSEHFDRLREDIQSQVGDSHRVVVIPAGVNVVDAGLNDQVLAELRAIRALLEGRDPLLEGRDRSPSRCSKCGEAFVSICLLSSPEVKTRCACGPISPRPV